MRHCAAPYRRAAGVPADIDGQLQEIQCELFSMGAELATPDPDAHGLRLIGDKHIERLERIIDEHENTLPPLKNFILPAGSPGSASLHLARAICRRAERRVVKFVRRHEASVSESLMIYLNRLGDLLFVLSRVVNYREGVAEVLWVKPVVDP